MATHFRRGFTLIELLVVMAIISLMIAILLPALQAARSGANLSASLSNLRQLAIAQRVYASDNDQSLVYLFFGTDDTNGKPNWAGVLAREGYVSARGVFWGPARDTSNLILDNPISQGNPWYYVGYGMNGGITASEYQVNAGTARPINVDHTAIPAHSRVLLMAETWNASPGSQPWSRAGWYEAKPNHQPGRPQRLYTYNGASPRAYLDGHAIASDSREIGWEAIDSFQGEWTYAGAFGINGYQGVAPWYANWQVRGFGPQAWE